MWPFKKEKARVINIGSARTRKKYPKNAVSNTKYRWYSFVPKNLLEQYLRFSNFYFLIVATMQLWKAVTPVNPVTTWFPLIFVTTVTAIKELTDDLRRWWSDHKANSRRYTVYRDGRRREIASSKVSVGDIIHIEDGEEAPADLIILKTSDEEFGSAAIMTANLDGEIDLKARMATKATYLLPDSDIQRFQGTIECPPPNDAV